MTRTQHSMASTSCARRQSTDVRIDLLRAQWKRARTRTALVNGGYRRYAARRRRGGCTRIRQHRPRRQPVRRALRAPPASPRSGVSTRTCLARRATISVRLRCSPALSGSAASSSVARGALESHTLGTGCHAERQEYIWNVGLEQFANRFARLSRTQSARSPRAATVVVRSQCCAAR